MRVVTIYEPNQRTKTGWFRTWFILLKNILDYRELIFQLFKRDFLMLYKKSFLGMGWLVITPVMGIASWVFMNVTGVLEPGDVGIPYPAYVLLGTSLFGLFLGFFTGASGTMQAVTGFILQVNFPHDVLLAKQILQQLANFAITFVITILILLGFGIIPSWMTIFFPLLIIQLMFLGAGLGLVSSVISVVAPDFNKGMAFVMSLVMFVTPIIYSDSINNKLLQNIISWNPLTYLIGALRDSIIYGRIQHLDKFMISTLFSIFVFLISWRIFYLSENKVVEKII